MGTRRGDRRRMLVGALVGAIAAATVAAPVVGATDLTSQTRFTGPSTWPGDKFGSAVAISGDTAVVGTRGGLGNHFVRPGAAYVFTWTGSRWKRTAKLVPDDGQAYDDFGGAVAISGSTVLVGATEATGAGSARTGAAYVFTRQGGTWTRQSKLTGHDGEEQDWFGSAVALQNGTALIGACNKDVARGAVYVFTSTHCDTVWTERAELTANDTDKSSFFGTSVSLSGSSALIGSTPTDRRPGRAYVFTGAGSSWTQEDEFSEVDGADLTDFGPILDYFGASVSISGDTALIGSIGSDGAKGAAYVFTRSGRTWSHPGTKLSADDGAIEDWFGWSVALEADTAAIGAPGRATRQGAAYVFTRIDGKFSQRSAALVGAQSESYDGVGSAVALSGGTALAGTSISVASRAAVYAFDGLPAPPAAVVASPRCIAGSWSGNWVDRVHPLDGTAPAGTVRPDVTMDITLSGNDVTIVATIAQRNEGAPPPETLTLRGRVGAGSFWASEADPGNVAPLVLRGALTKDAPPHLKGVGIRGTAVQLDEIDFDLVDRPTGRVTWIPSRAVTPASPDLSGTWTGQGRRRHAQFGGAVPPALKSPPMTVDIVPSGEGTITVVLGVEGLTTTAPFAGTVTLKGRAGRGSFWASVDDPANAGPFVIAGRIIRAAGDRPARLVGVTISGRGDRADVVSFARDGLVR